jgi:hypothetical protein
LLRSRSSQPVVDPEVVGPGAMAALEEVERTREKHKEQATNMAVLNFFDPTGISALVKPAMEAEQRKELDEKYQRVEDELRKTIAEVEAAKARNPTKGKTAAKPKKKESAMIPAEEAQAE